MSSRVSVLRIALVFTLLAMVLGLAVSACTRSVKLADTDEEIPAEPERIMLEVQNRNWSDINIFIIHDGRRHRLATVTATKDAAMEIPQGFMGDTGIFRIVVYRIGGRDSFTSEPISNRTGTTVRLTVESDLGRSSVGVW